MVIGEVPKAEGRHAEPRSSGAPRTWCRPPGGKPGKRGADDTWQPGLTHLGLLLPPARRDEAGQEQGEKAGRSEEPGHGGLQRLRLASDAVGSGATVSLGCPELPATFQALGDGQSGARLGTS
jgi:hypothetical protein